MCAECDLLTANGPYGDIDRAPAWHSAAVPRLHVLRRLIGCGLDDSLSHMPDGGMIMSGAILGPSRLIPFDKLPLGGSLSVGRVASLCCGGGLLFGAVGLGAFYSALGVARYIPEALASGAILIALVNWLYYR